VRAGEIVKNSNGRRDLIVIISVLTLVFIVIGWTFNCAVQANAAQDQRIAALEQKLAAIDERSTLTLTLVREIRDEVVRGDGRK
jgi:hypothetical protein